MSDQISLWNLLGEEEPDGVYMELIDGKWKLSSTTGNTSDSPKEPIKTKLSDILQHNVDEKYRLSKKACEGILRRAESRGKELPKVLKDALLDTAGVEDGEDVVFSKTAHPRNPEEAQGWKESDTAHTLNLFNMGESRADEVIVQPEKKNDFGEEL